MKRRSRIIASSTWVGDGTDAAIVEVDHGAVGVEGPLDIAPVGLVVGGGGGSALVSRCVARATWRMAVARNMGSAAPAPTSECTKWRREDMSAPELEAAAANRGIWDDRRVAAPTLGLPCAHFGKPPVGSRGMIFSAFL